MAGEVSGAFDFVRKLVSNLNGKDVDLPSFPDVVRRLQVALADPKAGAKDLVTIIESEPVLSGRLIQIANSAAISAAGNPASSIKAAVSRLGFNLVRLTAMTHAMRQIENQEKFRPIRKELSDLQNSSSEVAAICYVVCKKAIGRHADEAMLAGLLHCIGSLYILTHAQQADPKLREDPQFRDVVRDWQPTLGKAILDGWGVPESIGEAVASQDELVAATGQEIKPLARILAAAKLRFRLSHEPALRHSSPGLEELMLSLKIGNHNFMDVIAASQGDIDDMRQLLAA
jgi:HD-like signal output (HDOD) protein